MIREGIVCAPFGPETPAVLVVNPENLGSNSGEPCLLLTGSDLQHHRQAAVTAAYQQGRIQDLEQRLAMRQSAPDTNSNSSLTRRKLEAELRLAELQVKEMEMRAARGAR